MEKIRNIFEEQAFKLSMEQFFEGYSKAFEDILEIIDEYTAGIKSNIKCYDKHTTVEPILALSYILKIRLQTIKEGKHNFSYSDYSKFKNKKQNN
jgi:hypothetical protein